MAVTGLFLFGFVVMHMLGNLQIFLGQEALNRYAEALEDLPELLWPARVFLLASLMLHVWSASLLAIENRRARPTTYVTKSYVRASYASRTMMMSGLIVFFFIIYHLLHFTFGVIEPQYAHLVDSKGRDDVFSMVVLGFRHRSVSLTYITAMAVLGLHLSHGVSSLFQSLGLSDERRQPFFDGLARAAAFLIFIGNSSIPVSILTGLIHLPGKGV